MKPISKEDFYKIIYDKKLDIILSLPDNKTTIFKFRHGGVFGKCIERPGITDNEPYKVDDYFINEVLS